MSRWVTIYEMFLYTEKIIAVWSAVWCNFFWNHNSCWTRVTSVSHKARQPLWPGVNLTPLGECGFVCLPPFLAPTLDPDARALAQTTKHELGLAHLLLKNIVELIMGDDLYGSRCLSDAFF